MDSHFSKLQDSLIEICVVVGMDQDTGLVQTSSPEVSFFEQLLGGRLLAKIFFALNSQHQIKAIIMHLKYFPVSDWLKPHTVQFTITSCC